MKTKEKIKKILEKSEKKGSTYRELFIKCKIKPEEKKSFSIILEKMKLEGEIYEKKVNFFSPQKKRFSLL